MASLAGLFKKDPISMGEMFKVRTDIEKALADAGFTVTGAGTMDGAADISVERDGQTFLVDIKNLV